MSMNICLHTGRLTAKPQLRKTPDDVSVANFTLAVESRRLNKSTNEYTKDTQFLDFEIWDSGADVFTKRFDKGDLVQIKSSARVNKWKDKDTDKENRVVRFRVDEFDGFPRNVTKSADQQDEPQREKEPAGVGNDIPF